VGTKIRRKHELNELRSSFISPSLSSHRAPNVPSSLCLAHSFASLCTLNSLLNPTRM